MTIPADNAVPRESPAAALRRIALGLLCLALATAIWLPLVHLLFMPRGNEFRSPDGVAPAAEQLARRHARLWADASFQEKELERMRVTNPEWDYMGRTFFVLSLANMALREPARKAEHVALMDRIIADCREKIDSKGPLYFLMDYAADTQFVQTPSRSLFVDGELALMLGARRLVEEDEALRAPMREEIERIVARMEESPAMSCESYPNECWMFCNTAALAAIKMHDVLEGEDHGEFFARWLELAQSRLTHRESGMLFSSYTYDGELIDGPEGSSIWFAAHCLQLIDREFAEDQYRRAREQLARTLGGFGWAREWPPTWRGMRDVDSGPIIPIVEASAGSSGNAFIAAAAFGDDRYFNALAASLNFAGFPMRGNQGELRFAAGNQVGDAVILYSCVLGPLWDEIKRREEAQP